MSISLLARPRHAFAALATIVAAALALVGLTIAPAAAVAPTVSITPTTAAPNTITSFTVTVSATGTTTAAQSVTITVPAGFTNPSLDSWTKPDSSWGVSGPSGSTWTFSGPSNKKLNGSNTPLVAHFSAVTPATAGTYTWTIGGKSNDTNTIDDFVSPTVTVGVVKQDQTISFTNPGSQTYGTGPVTLGATASSGLAVSYTASGNCSVSGSQLTLGDVGSCSVTAHQAGDASWNAAQDVSQSFSIVKADQTITFPAISAPTYGDGPLSLSATATSGLAVTFSSSTTSVCTVSGTQLTIVSAGSCTVSAHQAGDGNYNAAPSNPQTFSVLRATATLHLSDLNHTYDGNQHGATVTTDPAGLGTVSITYNGSATEPTNAGSYAVHADLDNVNYSGSIDGTLVIAKKVVTGSATVPSKPYDGNDVATVENCAVNGVESGDDVQLDCSGATAAFDGSAAGPHDVTISGGTLTGTTGLGNYEFGGFEPVSGTIDQRMVTATLQAGDKVYNGTSVASATATLANVVAGEGASVIDVDVVSAAFADKNAGTNKTVTATVQLTGTGKDNYVLAATSVTDTANIGELHITGTFTAANKVYDGTTTATVSGRGLVGVLSPGGVIDDVQLSDGTAAFVDANVANGLTVSLTGATLTGADAANYALDSVASTTADITKRPVLGAFTAANRQWASGDVSATIVTRTLSSISGNADSGPVGDDDVILTGGVATFANPDVGTDKTVTVPATGPNAFTLGGNDAGNYSLAAGPWTTTASITEWYVTKGFYAPVDMTPAGGTRIYNTIKGGQTVPLKFEVFAASTAVEQTNVSFFGATSADQAAAFKISPVTCSVTASVDAVEVTTTGGTSFRYDTTAGQFIQNWKTPTNVGSCYAVSVVAPDGTTVGPAYFKITK